MKPITEHRKTVFLETLARTGNAYLSSRLATPKGSGARPSLTTFAAIRRKGLLRHPTERNKAFAEAWERALLESRRLPAGSPLTFAEARMLISVSRQLELGQNQ